LPLAMPMVIVLSFPHHQGAAFRALDFHTRCALLMRVFLTALRADTLPAGTQPGTAAESAAPSTGCPSGALAPGTLPASGAPLPGAAFTSSRLIPRRSRPISSWHDFTSFCFEDPAFKCRDLSPSLLFLRLSFSGFGFQFSDPLLNGFRLLPEISSLVF
jgi:hypothetical protein